MSSTKTGKDKELALSDHLIRDLLAALDQLSGVHPGFRPVHAKGAMCSGTFTPAAGASQLTRAPHAVQPSTRVIVRFSNSAGVPTVADNDPVGASPRGMAIRFYLGDHVHTDIIGHSHNGFPTRTGEEFLEFAHALAASGPDAPKPTPLESFLAKHPKAKSFVEAPKPIPTSFAKESFFGITAFRFSNQAGASHFGRFRVLPAAGNEYLTPEQAGKRSANFLMDDISQRLAQGPVQFRVFVQIAAEKDDPSDATVVWPESRQEREFGTITLADRVSESDPELRKIIFDPVPRVDGIDPSADPLIQVRAALYLLSGRRRRNASK